MTVHIHSLVENKLGELEYKKALERAADEKKKQLKSMPISIKQGHLMRLI